MACKCREKHYTEVARWYEHIVTLPPVGPCRTCTLRTAANCYEGSAAARGRAGFALIKAETCAFCYSVYCAQHARSRVLREVVEDSQQEYAELYCVCALQKFNGPNTVEPEIVWCLEIFVRDLCRCVAHVCMCLCLHNIDWG